MELSHTITNARSLEQVVEAINGSAFAGDLTGDQLAGQYAYEAVAGTEYTDENSLKAGLDVLDDAGAKFDRAEALKHAKNLVAQFTK